MHHISSKNDWINKLEFSSNFFLLIKFTRPPLLQKFRVPSLRSWIWKGTFDGRISLVKSIKRKQWGLFSSVNIEAFHLSVKSETSTVFFFFNCIYFQQYEKRVKRSDWVILNLLDNLWSLSKWREWHRIVGRMGSEGWSSSSNDDIHN